PPADVRTLLRLGAYQLVFTAVAPHAAVHDTVALAGGRAKGFVNAVLRRVATVPPEWPDVATRLSYPDWIVERLVAERGEVAAVVADGARPPLRSASFDHVLVDAPCSGLGALRRRPDARWRVRPGDIDALVAVQRSLLAAARTLVRPGGTLVYSVCTLTAAE